MFAIRALYVMATLFAMVSAKGLSPAKDSTIVQYNGVRDESDDDICPPIPAPTENCRITRIYDRTVFMTLCGAGVEYCIITVERINKATGDVLEAFGPFTFYSDGLTCFDVALKIFTAGQDYIITITCFDADDAVVWSETKDVHTAYTLCPICVIHGEPHFKTYDDLHYTYQGAPGCVYTASMDSVDGLFTVSIELEESPNSTPTNILTRVNSVTISLSDGTEITISRRRRVKINGVLIPLNGAPCEVLGILVIYAQATHENEVGQSVTVILPIGINVEYDGKTWVEISVVDEKWIGDRILAGLCADADSPLDTSDDLDPFSAVIPFADSWETSGCTLP